MYAFSENFILPLSHDEVVHGKRSLLEKMPGDVWQKFANLRLLLLTMYLHPGKKLLFMGGEFAQQSEWYCKQSLDWHLTETNPKHNQTMIFVRALNTFYRAHRALWECDFGDSGFHWLDFEDRDNSIISFARCANDPKDHLVCLLHFSPQTMFDYKIGLPENREYQMIFCSDDERFGGSSHCDEHLIMPINEPYAKAEYHARITVPPLAGVVLKPL
jgi:1,4-alpha-glucan branching enzyme